MRNLSILLLLFCLCLSCNFEKEMQLPAIKNAKITDVRDISPVYIFYDETKKDSTDFNKKNLITSTNWIVNVDKRLTLKQVFPHLQFLQAKREKAKNYKNYFTCNDTIIKNLGFLEFTEIQFLNNFESQKENQPINSEIATVFIHFFSSGYFNVSEFYQGKQIKTDVLEIKRFFNEKYFQPYLTKKNVIYLSFDKSLSFQDYITFKNKLITFTNEFSEFHTSEFIY